MQLLVQQWHVRRASCGSHRDLRESRAYRQHMQSCIACGARDLVCVPHAPCESPLRARVIDGRRPGVCLRVVFPIFSRHPLEEGGRHGGERGIWKCVIA